MTNPLLPDATRRAFFVQAAGALAATAILPDLARAAYRPAPGAEPISVALIGAGRQGRLILTELAKLENVKVLGVCDTNASRRDSAAKRIDGAQAFADHKQLLDTLKTVSAVIVATPTHAHKQVVLDALQAGKHVYCEAPLAHTIDDCKAIAAASPQGDKSRQQILTVGFEGRSNPIYKLARGFFQSDAVRDFVGAETQSFKKESWRFPPPPGGNDKAENWRLDPDLSAGLAGEIVSHQLDVVSWYTGKTPTSVFGTGSVRAFADGRTVPDTVSCSFGFDDDSRCTTIASLGNSYGGRFEVLRGTGAAIKLAWSHGWMFKEADAPTQGWEVYANRQTFFNDEGITLIADATKLAAQGALKEGVGLPNKPLYYALSDFFASITEHKPPACPAIAAAKTTIAAILANQAVLKNGVLAIDRAMLPGGA